MAGKFQRNIEKKTFGNVVEASNKQENIVAIRRISDEFNLRETPIESTPYRQFVTSSDGLNWSDMALVIANMFPAEIVTEPSRHTWVCMPFNDIDLEIERNGKGEFGRFHAGSVIITPPGTSNNTFLRTASPLIHVFIKNQVMVEVADELFDNGIGAIEILTQIGAAGSALANLLHAGSHMLSDGASSAWRSDYLARAMAAQVLAYHSQLNPTYIAPDERRRLTQTQIRTVKDFLANNLHGNFKFAKLAASIGLSRTAFFERFSNTLDMTPYQYLQTIRIENAKRMLLDRKLPIVEIALACGFSDQPHMTKSFKRHTGVTPNKYVGM